MRRPSTLRRLALPWCLLAAASLGASEGGTPAAAPSGSGHHRLVEGEVGRSPDAVATFREDIGRISILELAGDYARETGTGPNVEARAAVAQAFLAEHDDAYDFLVVFTRFPFDLGGTRAFHWLVRNDVGGIGLPLFDQSASFGSAGVLRGYCDLGRLADLGSEPGTEEFEDTLTILLHELLHQWAAYARFDDGGGPSDALLGLDDAHWSFLLDSRASVLYGNRWRDNQDGTFTSTAIEHILSPLDLYLAGFLPSQDVPPFALLESPATDPDRLPELGAVVSAVPAVVSVDQIVAAEGERDPPAAEAPDTFQAAFLYLVRPGESVSVEELAALERIRQGLLVRFTAATAGHASLEIHSSATAGGGGEPGTTGGGDPRGGPASVADALEWLRSRQETDGSWLDVPSTQVRDTATSLEVLTQLDAGFGGEDRDAAIAWLGTEPAPSTDHLARQITALSSQGESVGALAAELAARQNPDGGWGLVPGLGSDSLDSALALRALLAAASGAASASIEAGRAYLAGEQNPDGGWGVSVGGESRIRATAGSLHALAGSGAGAAIAAGAQWLVSRQNPDGGFGDSPSSAHHTAEILETLAELGALGLLPDSGAAAAAYLESRQDVAGSWEGSVFTTGLVARALMRLSHPNWRFVAEPVLEPIQPLDGEPAAVVLELSNDGNVATPVGLLQIFDGQPSGGTLIDEAVIAALDPGESRGQELHWDTTGAAGTHQLVALLDPFDQVAELSETDNRATTTVVVEPAPPGVELALDESALSITPAAPDRLPTDVLVQGLLRNLGQQAVSDAEVALSVGDPTAPSLEVRTAVSVPARSSVSVSFSFDLLEPGITQLSLLADPDDVIAEVDESNNLAAGSVATVPSFDLEVLNGDLALLDGPAHPGEDATFRLRLRNRGTSPTPTVIVDLGISDGSATHTLPPLQLDLDAGEEVERDVVWRVDLSGSLTLEVSMDPANVLPEIDEMNNIASLAFPSTIPTEPNLTVSVPDLQVDPDPALEGAPATLSAVVRNTGATAAGTFLVAFYDGAPEAGDLVAATSVPILDPGSSVTAQVPWEVVPDATERFLHVVVDADDAVVESDEADNRAFRPLTVLGLPDAAVSSAGLHFEPALPAPGQTVTLTVDVANLGEQQLVDLVVRAWDGDPASGGVPVGGDQVVPTIAGQSSGEAVFTWTLGSSPGVRSIHVGADPDGLIAEGDEANNTAQESLGVQDGDVFVSAPFFSPDGDGVRDSTVLFFVVDGPQDVEIEVVDRARDRVVRTFSGPELENVTSGEVVWDGRDENGRLVRDAEYEMRVVAEDGSLAGSASTALDTDRSSLLLAIGTQYEYLTNLTCEVGSQQFDLRIPRSEDYAYFIVEATSNPVYPRGVFRRALPFGALEEIVPASWLGNRSVQSLAVSPDGRRIAFRLQLGPDYQLWYANSDGSGLTELPLDFNPLYPEEDLGRPYVFGFGPQGDSLLVAGTWGFIAEYSLSEPGYPQQWWPVDGFYRPSDVTADGTRLALTDGWNDNTVVLIDLETGNLQELLPHSDYRHSAYPRWSADGQTLAVSSYEHEGVFLFDRDGVPLGSVALPTDGSPQYQRFMVPQWRGNGAEILVTGSHATCRTTDLVDVATLSQENLTASCENWPPPGEAFDPSLELLMPPGDMVWDPNDRSVLQDDAWTSNDGQAAIFFDEGFREEPFLEPWSADRFRFSPHGRHMVFWSDLTQADPGSDCYDGSDWWALTSLQNLTADLRVRLGPSGGYLLEGTAIDLHFDRYEIEWRQAGEPAGWHPVGPPVSTTVLDGYLGTWVPSGPGTYQIRLTAFDLAGNRLSRLRQVSTSTTPDITDVVVGPPLFSPNGDGVLDELTIGYRVLQPVNLEIRIFDADETLVRTFTQSHPVAGEIVSLPWDGRDEAGSRVPDGTYRVLVQQYEFFSTVDATPPATATPSLELVLDGPPPPGDRALLRLLVGAGAQDEHLDELELQRGSGPNPPTWMHQPALCRSAPAGGSSCEARVEIEQFTGQSFRAVADDHAGNRSVTPSAPAPETLRITGFGRHRTDPATGELLPLQSTHAVGSFTLEHGPVRFALSEAVVEDLTQVFIAYRPAASDDPWLEVPVVEFREPRTGEIVPWIPQPRFEVVWGLDELMPGRTWEVRLGALDSSGNGHPTQSLSLTTDGLLFHGYVPPWAIPGEIAPLIGEAGLDASTDLLLWAEEYVAAPLERATLYVTSEEDPRYAEPRAFEPAASADGVLLYDLVEWQACSTYTAWIEAVVRPEPGQPPRQLTSQTRTVELPCLELTFEVEPVTSDGCGDGPDERRVVTLRPRSLDGSQLQLLSLFGPGESGDEHLLFTVNQPESGAEYPWELDLSGVPEGVHALRASLTNVAGERVGGVARSPSPAIVESGLAIVDRQPPSAAITFPQPGDLVCPDSEQFPGVLEVQGEILDERGAAYLLEWGPGPSPLEWHSAWTQAPGEPPLGTLRHDPDGELGPAGGLYARALGGGWSKDLATSPASGLLDRVGDVSGEISVRLQAADGGGSHVCSTPVTFTLDALLEGASISASQPLFSPNGDGSLDGMSVTVTAAEPTSVDVAVYPGYLTSEGPVVTGPLARTLASGLAVPGSTALAWDGRDDGGGVVADGSYLILADWADACGNRDEGLVVVEVDTAAPAAAIVSPTPSTPLPMIVTVTASADDPHFFGWALSWGEGPAPVTWFPLAAGELPLPLADAIATWNTFGLSGVHTLRLVADDRAGNRSFATVSLDLAERTYLIDGFSADPVLFSPNGDGRREETLLQLGLQFPSSLVLTLLDDGGTEVARLIDDEPFAEGAHAVSWDGGAAADGDYRAHLEARLASDPTVVQVEELPVSLDRTPPAITVDHPVDGGWTASTDPVHGTVADERLAAWSVEIAPSAGGPWQEIAVGDRPVVDGPLASLTGLPEGAYDLRLVAEDQAEIRSTETLQAGIDDTPPAATLTAPGAGSLVGGSASPVPVEGSAADLNLESWSLELGTGSPPESWTALTGSQEPVSGELLAWDATQHPDGQAVLRLVVHDLAANEATAETSIAIDNTPPIAELTAPEQGSFVTGPTTVTGTAGDEHLLVYTVKLVRADGTVLALLAEGQEPVTGGVLGEWSALPPDGDYELRLEARDRVELTATAASEVTVDTQPPATPTGLAVELVGGDDAALSWDANTEPDLLGYRIYRDGVLLVPEPIAATSWLDVDLPPATYQYSVSAVDRAGLESDPAGPVTLSLDTTPPLVELHSPVPGETVAGLVEVRGTAWSPDDFALYRLWALPTAGGPPVLVRESTVPVQAFPLGQWDTGGLPEGSAHRLRLEAEDLSGNQAAVEVEVFVDNSPPAAPNGLTAGVTGSDVHLTWAGNGEPDLLGYLLYRGDDLVNANGPIVGDLRPYALTGTSYDDLSRPDGQYQYVLYAIDEAGNLSPPSAPATAEVETGPPHAVLVQPEDGSAFETPVYLLAQVDAFDVASVQFQYKGAAEATWIDLGGASTGPPFDSVLDPSTTTPPLGHGEYDLRAVATDTAGASDPEPAAISVTYADLTPPDPPSDLTTSVTGGTVTLSWAAVGAPDLGGYLAYRTDGAGVETSITADPISDLTLLDPDLPDGEYAYQVTAVDTEGNESDRSPSVPALVYTPSVDQPLTPRLEGVVDLEGTARPGTLVSGESTTASGSLPLPEVSADSEGFFRFEDIALSAGRNEVRLRATDSSGNVSKDAFVPLDLGSVPASPTGLAAAVTGLDVELSWNPNPEPTILGYRPLRDEAALLPDQALGPLTASASSESQPAANAVDGDPATAWWPGGSPEGQWIEVVWPDLRLVSTVVLRWYSPAPGQTYAPDDFRLESWSGEVWVPLARFENNEDAVNAIAVAPVYRTDRLRVLLGPTSTVALAEVEIDQRPVLAATATTDQPGDGTFHYTVAAVDEHGFESPPSDPVEVAVGDVDPPEAVVLTASVAGSDVELSWTDSSSPDVVAYEIVRDGEVIALQEDVGNLAFLDQGLVNGSYAYVVRAVDGAGNRSTDSNQAVAVVAVPLLPPPENLQATPLPSGNRVLLTWTAGSGAPPASYRLLRSSIAGGPYDEVGTTAEAAYEDGELTNGTAYYWVVVALDELGNASQPSNEATATPEDTEAPPVPVLHHPTIAERPVTFSTASILLAAVAEPRSTVRFLRDGEVAGSTTAADDDDTFWGTGAEGAEVRPSPDGTLLWGTVWDEAADDWSWRLWRFDGSPVEAVDRHAESVRWSSDSTALVYAQGTHVYAYDVAHRTDRLLATAEEIDLAVPSPDGASLAVVGRRSGPERRLWHVRIDGEVWTDIQSVSSLTRVLWSPDGVRFAFSSSGWHLYEVDTAETTSLPSGIAEAPSWAPDGDSLLLSRLLAGERQLWEYRLDTQALVQLTTDAAGATQGRWSPDGSAIAYLSGGSHLVLASATGSPDRTLLELAAPCAPCDLRWVPGGALFAYTRGGLEWVRLTPEGTSVLAAVPLLPGENHFIALATDESGNESPSSEEIVVLRSAAGLPDLVVEPPDLAVIPAGPLQGSSAQISVTVHNTGEATASHPELSSLVLAPDGSLTPVFENALLADIPPGGSRTLSTTVTFPGPPGTYRLIATADPRDLLFEAEEENNLASRPFPLVPSTEPLLLVSTDRSSYGAFETVSARADLLHGGPPMDGQLAVQVVDAAGSPVTTLVEMPVHLEAGTILEIPSTWFTGQTWAGSYRVAAELTDGTGTLRASGEAAFEILEEIELSVAVGAQQPLYLAGDPVSIHSGISYLAGNALLDGCSLQVTLDDPSGFETGGWTEMLGSLLPGDSVDVTFWWSSQGAPSGQYVLRLLVTRAGETLGTATGSFEIAAGPTEVIGALELSDRSPPLGQPVDAVYQVTNEGPEPLLAVPLRVRVLEPVSAVTMQLEETLVDLPPGLPIGGSFVLETTGLEEIPYVVLLQAELEDESGALSEVNLAVETLQPVDGTGPALQILRPAEDELLGLSTRTALLLVQDPTNPVALVECRPDDGDWAAAIPDASDPERYTCDLAALTEGPHVLEARALDEAGNTTARGPVPFEVDLTPPAIQVLGVADGEVYTEPVTPEVVIDEAHPATQSVLLDGGPFTSGTVVDAPGDHLLQIEADDAAGNHAARLVHFTLLSDVEPLELVVNTVNDVDDGLCGSEHCSLREAIRVANQSPSPAVIRFAIPGLVIIRTLRPRSPLPPITTPLTLDGLTQPGAACEGPPTPAIVLDGAALTGPGDGLVVTASDVLVRGLAVVRFPGHGVRLSGGSRDVLECSRIGSLDATDPSSGNAADGILLDGGTEDTQIGSAGCPTPCNVIAFNGASGVALAPSAGSGNEIRGNSVFRNDGLAIDLGDDGLTLNDPLDEDAGANDLQNYPVILAVRPGETSEVDVAVSSVPESDFGIDLFRVDTINADRGGARLPPPFGEADHLVARGTVSTDAAGEGLATISVPADLSTSAITATATGLGSGSTSELSAAFIAHYTHSIVDGLRAVVDPRGGSFVEWRTTSESGVFGFRLFREPDVAAQAAGNWIELTASSILALEDSPRGALYRVPVGDLQPGQLLRLLLIEEGTRGNRRVYGPFLVRAVPAEPGEAAPPSPAGVRSPVASLPEGEPGSPPSAPESAERGSVVKIGVREDGLYRVDAEQLAAASGLDEAVVRIQLATRQARLEVGGMSVGWLGEDNGSALYFYGEAPDDPYSPHNVYWLDLDATSEADSYSGLSPLPSPGGTFPSTVRFEENLIAATNLALDPDEDFWFWAPVLAGSSGQTTTFDLPDPAPPGSGGAELTLRLYAPPAPGASEQHSVLASLNGSPLGQVDWQGWGWREVTFSLADGLVEADGNLLEISAALPPGATLSFFYVDGYSVTYPRSLLADEGALLVTDAAQQTLTVEELPASDPWVIDLSVPRQAIRVTDPTVSGTGPWSASWVPRAGASRFWVGDPATASRTPEWVVPEVSSRLVDGRNGADLLVLSTPAMLQALEPLLEQREIEGLEVARVDIQDVYDELNFGLGSPRALEAFLEQVATTWTVVPRYVLLGGAGTFDYRDHLGLGGNVVPPLLTRTADGLFSTDLLLGDVDGDDGIPDLAVGRIPARSAAEMADYVQKILAYESGGGAWSAERLLLAGRRDGTADFGADTRELAQAAPGTDPALLLADDLPLPELRDQLFASIQGGVGLLHYLGHGGIGQLGQQPILTSQDAGALTNAPALPVVVAPTCVANRHELPAVPSLGEALVVQPDGGAAAVFAATGLSQHGSALHLSQSWLERGWPPAGGAERLGDLVLEVIQEALERGATPEALRTYTLLGDPAGRIPE